jgi:predicted membrane-bound spermidine synthase
MADHGNNPSPALTDPSMISVRRASIDRWRIGCAFFLSGAAALIYQVAWQRLLFVVVGVDVESVTIVVSTFMLGLGIGALIGGWLADAMPHRILWIFCLFEASIGTFGLFSADLINSMGQVFAGLFRPAAAALSFAILLLPTMCMGATLPMLIADAFRESKSIGVSTGTLYFINTVGAAVGACAVGFVLFYWIDIRQTVLAAATLNFAAAAIVASIRRRQ